MTEPKTIACVLYPGLTPLDLVGPLQVFGALAGVTQGYRVVVVGRGREVVDTDTPLGLRPSHTFDEVPSPEIVVVPGGGAPTWRAATDERLLAYLRQAAAESAEVVASVCTGSLILAAAGLLDGRKANTHWSHRRFLAEFGAEPVADRWVEDGKFLTAAGVSAGVDMALHLVARLAGEQVARAVQFAIEYDPEPPQGALDWAQAPHEWFAPWTDRMMREGLAGTALAERLLRE
ncbi:DJ-1/PfpI family protein [Amycolatopsis sp. 195334CR]|uniref:DJ-1/PfpI family protein n=1 Tax=Amycolatopsis sp. 195334CR TaxID=2814588 RepID=UPI001A90308C|nr:DJ-1/PfpI family protein [Amycolatopsis sp. 195334CR]MBN6038837.1 DJ-1/PfpI family protein [Amycolatopsis sp. 195334CR]